MELDREALKTACFSLAKNTLWKMGPVDVSVIQAHAEKLYEEALCTELDEFIARQNRDPNMITRAVIYLNNTHAMPPMKDDTRWFYDMLTALIELACPNNVQNTESINFLKDIEKGVSIACSSYDR